MRQILIVVCDDARLRATIGDTLRDDESAPILATAAEALRSARAGMLPDVLVLDLDLPCGSTLRDELECAVADHVPVIALSSKPRRLVAAGRADAVVLKPLDGGQLRQRVDRACERPRGAM